MTTDAPRLDDGAAFSEEQLRAGAYSLLAELLKTPPNQSMLARLGQIAAENTQVGGMAAAWAQLKQAAGRADIEPVDDEFHALFIGLGRGELVPHGSWYLTGSLMERPLAELRRDLAELGFERQRGVREPEDHAAALCEVMALMIMDDAISWGRQQTFFETHVGSWLGRFFRDLERAESADFYRAVGRLGGEFISVEQRYLSMLV